MLSRGFVSKQKPSLGKKKVIQRQNKTDPKVDILKEHSYIQGPQHQAYPMSNNIQSQNPDPQNHPARTLLQESLVHILAYDTKLLSPRRRQN